MSRVAWLSGLVLLSGLSGWSGSATGRPAPTPSQYTNEVVDPGPDWTESRAALGKRLFFDKVLSRDRTVSCATCHDPARAFTDGRRTGVGIEGREGARNTPTIVNRALGRHHFWDGRAATLEEQALGPIANPKEMDLPIDQAVARLREDAAYRAGFEAAFGGEPTASRLAAALGAYERTIYSVDAPFDRFLAGDQGALTPAARRGMELFAGKARCGECHTGPNFTDELFHSVGLKGDDGRGRVTGKESDRGTFRTPTLREIAGTAPYMHDGSLATLLDVVEYYDRGGAPHPNLSSKVVRLSLSSQEKADLVSFLESLSGRIVEVSSDMVE
jgi:cytochrome c peroxidase